MIKPIIALRRSKFLNEISSKNADLVITTTSSNELPNETNGNDNRKVFASFLSLIDKIKFSLKSLF